MKPCCLQTTQSIDQGNHSTRLWPFKSKLIVSEVGI